MRLLILLTGFLIAKANVIFKKDRDGIIIDPLYYETETLKEDIDRPYLLAVDTSTNILYFSYSIEGEEDGSKTARINLNTKEFADITGVNNGFAQTVDQKTHEIYIGGSDGIYKYDYGKDKADLIAEKDVNIWNLYFKDVLYFSVYPSQFLFTHSNGQTERFKELEDTKIDNFVIDNDNFIFFTNATGLFAKEIGHNKKTVLYKEYKDNNVRGLTVDRTGKVYACFQDGIYLVHKNTVTIEKVIDIDDAFGIAFDVDNNIIYSDGWTLVRLKANYIGDSYIPIKYRSVNIPSYV